MISCISQFSTLLQSLRLKLNFMELSGKAKTQPGLYLTEIHNRKVRKASEYPEYLWLRMILHAHISVCSYRVAWFQTGAACSSAGHTSPVKMKTLQ